MLKSQVDSHRTFAGTEFVAFEYIKEFDINALNVLAKNKQSDLHFVFDAKKYIGYSQWQSKPIIPPIVIIMLYSRDVRLVMCQLGYPVIDSSQFKK